MVGKLLAMHALMCSHASIYKIGDNFLYVLLLEGKLDHKS